MILSLPTYRAKEVSEEQIQTLSVEECIRLRQELRAVLTLHHQTNPGVLTRFLNRINERLCEAHYNSGLEMAEAQEG